MKKTRFLAIALVGALAVTGDRVATAADDTETITVAANITSTMELTWDNTNANCGDITTLTDNDCEDNTNAAAAGFTVAVSGSPTSSVTIAAQSTLTHATSGDQLIVNMVAGDTFPTEYGTTPYTGVLDTADGAATFAVWPVSVDSASHTAADDSGAYTDTAYLVTASTDQ